MSVPAGGAAIGAFSPHARPSFPIAAPVTWEDIQRGLRSDAFSMQNFLRCALRGTLALADLSDEKCR